MAAKGNTFRSGAIASRIAQLSVIDALFLIMLMSRYEKTVKCLEKTTEEVKTKRY